MRAPKGEKSKKTNTYRHGGEKALMRPEAGGQRGFKKHKAYREYRYDSSFAPELQWDENAARPEGERLIDEIIKAGSLEKAVASAKELQHKSGPFLNWCGKVERTSLKVPTLPLFVHERLSTEAILDTLKQHKRDRTESLDLFGEGDKSVSEKIRGAYEHKNGWQNRLILGDSLQVMNSLLAYESMAGKVQTIYIDPPYGIKFGSNFQPFVRNREVKDNDDASLSREPETVQAYRDTWKLGTHSWLAFLRDRLLMARELLSDTGSCFLQISDDNVHLARMVMEEVFGRDNFCKMISYRTTPGDTSVLLPTTGDYLVWFAKNIDKIKYRKLYIDKKVGIGTGSHYTSAECPETGQIIKLTKDQIANPDLIPKGHRVVHLGLLKRAGYSRTATIDYEFEGKTYNPGPKHQWKTNREGLKRLHDAGRLYATSNSLMYKRYFDDFPMSDLGNVWTDTGGAFGKLYSVQTSPKVVERCILMTSDPGDLVLDPTCGSGTTAYVSEKWGRRWIAIDVSRVPISLARQRLLTSVFDYYALLSSSPSGGFAYARKKNNRGVEIGGIVPHTTLRTITTNEPPEETLRTDKPEKTPNVSRVCGPFCVEAVIPFADSPYAEQKAKSSSVSDTDAESGSAHISRMIEVLRSTPSIMLSKGNKIKLKNIRRPAKSLHLHALATEYSNSPPPLK